MSAQPDPWRLLESAERLFDQQTIEAALDRMAADITARLSDVQPLVLAVMGGAVVFTGQLLPRLKFPLDFDYIHVSRYGQETSGGELLWKKRPHDNVEGRVVLVLDDILDEGHTMAAIREQVMAQGAQAFYSAVFTNKLIVREKPLTADFVGLDVPNRYVFGFGMDAYGQWRNLPELYALPEA